MLYSWHISAGFWSETAKISGAAAVGYFLSWYTGQVLRRKQRTKLYENLADLFILMEFFSHLCVQFVNESDQQAEKYIERAIEALRDSIKARRFSTFLNPDDYKLLEPLEVAAALEVRDRAAESELQEHIGKYAKSLKPIISKFSVSLESGHLNKPLFDKCVIRRRPMIIAGEIARGNQELKDLLEAFEGQSQSDQTSLKGVEGTIGTRDALFDSLERLAQNGSDESPRQANQ
jgi:hypothetical protein